MPIQKSIPTNFEDINGNQISANIWFVEGVKIRYGPNSFREAMIEIRGYISVAARNRGRGAIGAREFLVGNVEQNPFPFTGVVNIPNVAEAAVVAFQVQTPEGEWVPGEFSDGVII